MVVGQRADPRAGPLRAVTFDYWNTLVVADIPRVRAERHQRVSEVLEGHGVATDPARIDHALAVTVDRFNESWAANRQFTGAHGAQVLVGELGVHDLGPAAVAEVVDAFVRAAARVEHDLAPGVRDVLDALLSAGVAVGIVCDVGLTPSDLLRAELERHGVLGAFDHWSFSDEVGVYKPDPAIFAHALDGLGVDEPVHAVHVGDLRRTDVHGARNVGMRTVRFAGVHDDPPATDDADADEVITDHRELVSLLFLE
jgi:putative hydrolase of the HAD superfamily